MRKFEFRFRSDLAENLGIESITVRARNVYQAMQRCVEFTSNGDWSPEQGTMIVEAVSTILVSSIADEKMIAYSDVTLAEIKAESCDGSHWWAAKI